MSKKILIICATGVATSTVLVDKVRNRLASKGINADIQQGKVSDLLTGGTRADFIVATTQIPDSITIPVVNGLPILTGIGLDKVYEEIERLASEE